MRAPFRISLAMIVVVGMFTLQTAHAQDAGAAKGKRGGAKTGAAAPADADGKSATDTLKTAADALGMLRGPARIDAINTMEFWGSGTTDKGGQMYKTDYHVSLGYNPPGMRIEMTRTPASGGAPEHTLQVVNDKYAWSETEVGGGLEGSKGTATAEPAALKDRSLLLWTFPFGAIKAAMAAGDKAKLSMENGATVVTFPLSGPLDGVTEKITLDNKNMVSKVEVHADKPMPGMVTETDYSNYADLGDITSDVQFPGHIVQKADGKTVLDITVKMDDPNNPFLIFPAPPSVMK